MYGTSASSKSAHHIIPLTRSHDMPLCCFAHGWGIPDDTFCCTLRNLKRSHRKMKGVPIAISSPSKPELSPPQHQSATNYRRFAHKMLAVGEQPPVQRAVVKNHSHQRRNTAYLPAPASYRTPGRTNVQWDRMQQIPLPNLLTQPPRLLQREGRCREVHSAATAGTQTFACYIR